MYLVHKNWEEKQTYIKVHNKRSTLGKTKIEEEIKTDLLLFETNLSNSVWLYVIFHTLELYVFPTAHT